MTPRALWALAREVHDGAYPVLDGAKLRAVAMIARRALEDGVEGRLGLGQDTQAAFAAQLCALDAACSPEVAARASLVWSALSRVCHYHGYELAPTHGEVGGWLAEVDALLERLA